VKLTVIRGGSAAEPHEVELTRELPATVEVKSRTQGDGIGYVRVASFGRRAADQLKTQVAALAKGGATRLIVDVRNTAAGDLAEGTTRPAVCRFGTLRFASREPAAVKIASQKGDGSIASVTLLVDSGTSGPAEVFAAALAGSKRAELLANAPSGGRAQNHRCRRQRAWITSTRYLTPGGAQIQAKGPSPTWLSKNQGEFGAPAPAAQSCSGHRRLSKKGA
jgi:carboxyl-terminal processing protease